MSHERKIGLYVTDTMADWEYAYLTTQIAEAEQCKPGRFSLEFVGDAPVRSLGGLYVAPTMTISQGNHLDALIIPGASTYHAGHEDLAELVGTLLGRDVPVAAICGATFFLARNGWLDERKHTSNVLEYLQSSGYAGSENYVDEAVVTDRGVTTAGGIHPVQFTAEVMRVIGLYPQAIIDSWEQLYLTGESEHYATMMKAFDDWQHT